MGVYVFRVPVEGYEYYEVEADSVDEANRIVNEDVYALDAPISSNVEVAGEFEFEAVIEPGDDEEF